MVAQYDIIETALGSTDEHPSLPNGVFILISNLQPPHTGILYSPKNNQAPPTRLAPPLPSLPSFWYLPGKVDLGNGSPRLRITWTEKRSCSQKRRIVLIPLVPSLRCSRFRVCPSPPPPQVHQNRTARAVFWRCALFKMLTRLELNQNEPLRADLRVLIGWLVDLLPFAKQQTKHFGLDRIGSDRDRDQD